MCTGLWRSDVGSRRVGNLTWGWCRAWLGGSSWCGLGGYADFVEANYQMVELYLRTSWPCLPLGSGVRYSAWHSPGQQRCEIAAMVG